MIKRYMVMDELYQTGFAIERSAAIYPATGEARLLICLSNAHDAVKEKAVLQIVSNLEKGAIIAWQLCTCQRTLTEKIIL